jgi:hypothetical protein
VSVCFDIGDEGDGESIKLDELTGELVVWQSRLSSSKVARSWSSEKPSVGEKLVSRGGVLNGKLVAIHKLSCIIADGWHGER